MIGRTILIAFFAVGVLADINEEELNALIRQMSQRQDVMTMRYQMERFQKAGQSAYTCLKRQINDDEIKKEVEEANRNGTINNMIKKYCAKTPEMKTCLHTYGSDLSSVINITDNTFNNSTDELLDFVCYNDGERISTFIAEGGPTFIQDNAFNFNECVDRISKGPNSVDFATTLNMEKICSISNKFFACIEDVFKGSNSTYVRDTAVSLFQLQRKMYPC